jgi:twitching motility two-component system response regulator PilH
VPSFPSPGRGRDLTGFGASNLLKLDLAPPITSYGSRVVRTCMVVVRTWVNRKAILKPTILLVEDSPVQKLANEKILITAGYLVLIAVDGPEAVRLAREANPDLMLLDLVLPKLSGVEVLQTMKRDPATATIPVIVLSQLPQENEAELKRAGAAGYFTKSRLAQGAAGQVELVDLIEKTLRQTRELRIPMAPARAGTPSR